MLTGKELILATRPYARENRVKSWVYTLATFSLLTVDFFAILFVPYLAVRIVCSILMGLLMVRMFIIYHDYEHHAILNRSIPAKILMPVYGAMVLAPQSIWKRSHDHHHKHNSKLFTTSIGSYRVLTKNKFLSLSKKEQRAYLASRHPLTILFGYFTTFIYGMCWESFRSNPRKHYDSLLALVGHLLVSVAVIWYLGWLTWLLAIFYPFFFNGALGAYLFYAQHNFPGVVFSDNGEWCYEKAALESSSFMDLNPIMHWFTGNIGYHHIHHLNARIPFYRLPEVMARISELQHPKVTTLNPKDIIACLKLKVWDQEGGAMVSLDDAQASLMPA
ncbi:MAG: fatty acid desaturase [Bacteroidia bacterium]|nr:fatty acid desaturase [Bacteroidia bacterium]